MARIVNQSLVRNPECDLRVAAMKTEGKQQSGDRNFNYFLPNDAGKRKTWIKIKWTY